MVPPRVVRRAVLAPLLLALTAAAVAALPLLTLAGAAAALVLPGRWLPLRLVWVGVVYLLADCAALLACFGLWIASGFGWRLRSPAFQDAHYALLRLLLSVLARAAEGALQLEVTVEEPRWPRPDRPFIVLSRHAGPGDSFLIVHRLLSVYRLRPRIVLKSTLQYDPGLDVLANRLPTAFISPRPKAGTEAEVISQIRKLAEGLEPGGALLIFPEGGNFSERRRLRSITKLEQLKLSELARRARAMRHLLAPRPGGTAAAIAAAPAADVVFVAHTGLEALTLVASAWRRAPVTRQVRARWWLVPARRVPREPEAQTAWLYEWWGRMDEWIGQHRPGTPAGTDQDGAVPV